MRFLWPTRVRHLASILTMGVLAVCAGASLAPRSVAIPHVPHTNQLDSRPTIALDVTVTDADGQPVSALTQQDFTVLDNGVPASIQVFSSGPLPMTAALMVDMSDDVLGEYARVQAAARHVVQAMGATDRLRVGSYGAEIVVSPLLSGDKAQLSRVIAEELWPGGPVPVWLAAVRAMDSLADERGRRVVWLLHNSQDPDSPANCAPSDIDLTSPAGPCATLESVRAKAEAGGFLIYAVGLEGDRLRGDLARLADATGGASFDLAPGDDLDRTLDRVIDELHHQYVLGFAPSALDGKVHQLQVTMGKPGLTARARKSYVAEAPK